MSGGTPTTVCTTLPPPNRRTPITDGDQRSHTNAGRQKELLAADEQR
jgi:hypothetical protein